METKNNNNELRELMVMMMTTMMLMTAEKESKINSIFLGRFFFNDFAVYRYRFVIWWTIPTTKIILHNKKKYKTYCCALSHSPCRWMATSLFFCRQWNPAYTCFYPQNLIFMNLFQVSVSTFMLPGDFDAPNYRTSFPITRSFLKNIVWVLCPSMALEMQCR